MFHVLYMIDQGQFQSFGWKQAAVWAVEEPESSLHRQLQVRLALLLRAYALPEESRFQILVTTHNDVFMFGATAGFLTTLDDSPATVIERKPVLELAQEAASQEITAVPSPALQFPFDTLVLTEGDTDAKVLTRAAEITQTCRSVRFTTPSQLDPSLEGDGSEAIKRFVSNHRHAIKLRWSSPPRSHRLGRLRRQSAGNIDTLWRWRYRECQKDGQKVGRPSGRGLLQRHRTFLSGLNARDGRPTRCSRASEEE